MQMNEIGKFLIAAGVFTVVLGIVLMLVGRLPGGMLPGDIFIQRKSFTFFFPVVTSIVISIVLTVVLNLFFRR